MDITADPIVLGEDEERAFLRAMQVAQLAEPTLTPNALATRLLRKMLRGWAANARAEFSQRNRHIVNQIAADLAIDPDRDTKLAALGYEVGDDGVLRRLDEEP